MNFCINNCGHLGIRPKNKEEGSICIECRKYICSKCVFSRADVSKEESKLCIEKSKNINKCLLKLTKMLTVNDHEVVELKELNSNDSIKLSQELKKCKEMIAFCNSCFSKPEPSFFEKIGNRLSDKPFFSACCECRKSIGSLKINDNYYFMCINCENVWTKDCSKDEINHFNRNSNDKSLDILKEFVDTLFRIALLKNTMDIIN